MYNGCLSTIILIFKLIGVVFHMLISIISLSLFLLSGVIACGPGRKRAHFEYGFHRVKMSLGPIFALIFILEILLANV